MLSDEDIAVLSQQDMRTLAQWYCLLNSWGWPTDLPNAEPEQDVAGGRRREVMGWIVEAIGFRECLREWNRAMDDEAFNDLWRGSFEGHKPSYDRYWKRLREEARHVD